MIFNPRDSSLFVSPERDDVFARLRECDTFSVDRNGPVPVYSLVRYADVERAYKEPELFSPCAGLTLDTFDPKVCETPSRMLEMAPPGLHRRLKAAMQGSFRGPALAAIRERAGEHLDRFLAASAGGEAVDFVDAYAREAGTLMMAELLGLLPEQAERLGPLLGRIGEVDAGESAAAVLRRQKGEFRLMRELGRVVAAHRAEGRTEGLLGALLESELEGEPLSDSDVALNCLNVVVAGTGASQHTLAGAAAVWAEHPQEVAAVAADPRLARPLIDETLRWLSPVLHLTRLLTAEVELAGETLPRGACVCLWNVSANRDERVFEQGSSFMPERPPGRNLAFGAGPQYCLGAEVVRAQLELLLAATAARGIRFELAGAPRWMRSNALAGVEALPLRLRG